MRYQKDISGPLAYRERFSKRYESNVEDRPIKVKVQGGDVIVKPTSPMYQVAKWYGTYEEL